MGYHQPVVRFRVRWGSKISNPYPYPGWPYLWPGGFCRPVTITRPFHLRHLRTAPCQQLQMVCPYLYIRPFRLQRPRTIPHWQLHIIYPWPTPRIYLFIWPSHLRHFRTTHVNNCRWCAYTFISGLSDFGPSEQSHVNNCGQFYNAKQHLLSINLCHEHVAKPCNWWDKSKKM